MVTRQESWSALINKKKDSLLLYQQLSVEPLLLEKPKTENNFQTSLLDILQQEDGATIRVNTNHDIGNLLVFAKR